MCKQQTFTLSYWTSVIEHCPIHPVYKHYNFYSSSHNLIIIQRKQVYERRNHSRFWMNILRGKRINSSGSWTAIYACKKVYEWKSRYVCSLINRIHNIFCGPSWQLGWEKFYIGKADIATQWVTFQHLTHNFWLIYAKKYLFQFI